MILQSNFFIRQTAFVSQLELTNDTLCSLAMDSKLALLAVSDEYHVCWLRGHCDLLALSSNLTNNDLEKVVLIVLYIACS